MWIKIDDYDEGTWINLANATFIQCKKETDGTHYCSVRCGRFEETVSDPDVIDKIKKYLSYNMY